jgi:hypothetical protein
MDKFRQKAIGDKMAAMSLEISTAYAQHDSFHKVSSFRYW